MIVSGFLRWRAALAREPLAVPPRFHALLGRCNVSTLTDCGYAFGSAARAVLMTLLDVKESIFGRSRR